MGISWPKPVVGNKKPLSEPKQCCNSSELEVALLDKSVSDKLKSFSLNDLNKATKNFRQQNLLGEGHDGHVFKGWIDETTYAPINPGRGIAVAIKKFKPGKWSKRDEEWLEEINYFGQLHHENMVKLIGYCLECENRLLVYEFMTKGTLENHLFRKGGEPIGWATRVNIAIGVARGIAFLHSLKENVVILDLRASSILLDSDFNAKLSSFCLATYDPSEDAFKFLAHLGYYVAKDFVMTGYYTPNCAVYSFGIVMFELLAGRRAIEFETSRQEYVDSVKALLSDRGMVLRIMDARLGGQYSKKGAQAAAALALQCLNRTPKFRPPIVDVLAALERLNSLDAI